ncbi:interleukin 17a/f3 [Salminus brasiliensis]|uniref:interleukin 17a/f3 n=1 Tax=Salminus brasiliensis TaxID=930266 RepID=UPI003B8313DC
MQVSLVFRAVLVLGLVALLLGGESSPAQGNRSKKKGKSKPKQGSQGKIKKLWITLDPAFINFTDSSPVPPSRSISPWRYEASHDESRIPSLIFEAKCERKGCMTKEEHEDSGLESKPVYYQILVLRRVKGKKKKYSLKLEKMTIAVGCTCVAPIVISQKE